MNLLSFANATSLHIVDYCYVVLLFGVTLSLRQNVFSILNVMGELGEVKRRHLVQITISLTKVVMSCWWEMPKQISTTFTNMLKLIIDKLPRVLCFFNFDKVRLETGA